MTRTSLSQYSPDLDAYIDGLAEDQLRTIAWAVALWVVGELEVRDPRIADLVRSPTPVLDESQRLAVEQLYLELDEIGWDLQDLIDEGTATEEEYAAAFVRARAVNALWDAMDPHAETAASRALYESISATDVETVTLFVRSLDGVQ